MGMRGMKAWFVAFVAAFGFVPAAHAQWAVIDVGAIAQLIQEVQQTEQVLQTAQNQLSQAQAAYQAMTGSRGMQNLLGGTVRNYLPGDWAQIQAAVSGTSSPVGPLSSGIRSSIAANSVLSPAALAALSPTQRAFIQGQRQNTALLQVLSQQALAATSARFASLQQLITTIGSATDPKAVADLQARIAAEQTMLQTDETKLQALYQAAQAEELARRSRLREQAIADGGSLRRLPPMGL